MSQGTQAMLPDRKHAPVKLGRVLILGLGKSGKAACEYCSRLIGDRIDFLGIAVGDVSADAQAYLDTLDTHRIKISCGRYDLEESYDLCIVSPGISQFSEFYQNAQSASAEIISEVEFAWRESKASSTWVAITGTNGKTTTTALTADILASTGLAAAAVGNIGSTCLEAVMEGNTELYVAEVSSYQLASTRYFAPKVAILLNITPDHLIWHTSHEEYVKAKAKVFANLGQDGTSYAVIDAGTDESRALLKNVKNTYRNNDEVSYIALGIAAGLQGDMRLACGAENAAFMQEGVLHVALAEADHVLCALDELHIKGVHNAANALAAATAALVLGLDDAQVAAALRTFKALEHRLEDCGSIAGVSFFNDSKATNVDATCKALDSFAAQHAIFLLGGKDKKTNLSDLVEKAEQKAKAVVCYGEAGKRIYDAFIETEVPRFLESGLAAAFECACDQAEDGDAVVLSPACASFDEFDSFEHRGRVFKEYVRRRSLSLGG